MKFSKDYSKLDRKAFTTIRKNNGFYKVGQSVQIQTPTRTFRAKTFQIDKISKEKITDVIARFDADCSKEELVKMLENWYGKNYNDFVIIGLRKECQNTSNDRND